MTSNNDLAIFGGLPTFSGTLPKSHTLSEPEIAAATRVIRSGPLSAFHGKAGDGFLGGPEVLALENDIQQRFNVRHAVCCNSATTGLHMAIVALGIGPGDEVILPSYTLSATAAAILMNGAVPIFADIDPLTFCIDPASVQRLISARTKAIIAVNIQGQASDFGRLIPLANKHRLPLIEDNAQSPGATWRGISTGTVGAIGVFSLNVNKVIQTGEGGFLVTNNDTYALRARLSRNHGESVVGDLPGYDGGPIIGSNYRMTEIGAAVARVQLARLDGLNRRRIEIADRLRQGLSGMEGFTLPFVHSDNFHVYYRFVLKMNPQIVGISRSDLFSAVKAEGFPISSNIGMPIHLLPVFQQRRAFNATDFPFGRSSYYDGNPDYSEGSCPVAERICAKESVSVSLLQYPLVTDAHVDLFVMAFKKVLLGKKRFSRPNSL